MRSRSARACLKARVRPLAPFALLGLLHCAGTGRDAPVSPAPGVALKATPTATAIATATALPSTPASVPLAPPPAGSSDVAPATTPVASDTPAPAPADTAPVEAAPPARCSEVPPLGPDGAVPPAPPHTPVGEDIAVPGDRPVYVLPGESGDPRVIVYLHGMCGDVAAADYFRGAARAHGTLISLRGDTPCAGDRFKWRDDPTRIQERLRAAVASVGQAKQTPLSLNDAVLFGYSQGADRAEKLAGRYPKQYRRVVLGGPPLKASPLRLFGAGRVAILGGELETTDNMRAGAEALQAAGIACRFFTLDCAYHGYYGTRAEAQLAEVLDWVSGP